MSRYGKKKDLKKPRQYWYDEANHTVSLYCEKNPAEAYQTIECALRRHIIDQSFAAYVTYENLTLKYGAAHGVGGAATKFITVRNCDIGYIGGGDQRGGEHTVRFGNGVEFWHNAHDCVVEGCRIWEIYDAALTNQASGSAVPASQYRLSEQRHLEQRILVRVLEPPRDVADEERGVRKQRLAWTPVTDGDMPNAPTRAAGICASTPAPPRPKAGRSQ